MMQLRNTKKKLISVPLSINLKSGDTVMVITGKDKGKTGTIRKIFRGEGRLVVEGANMVKKARKPNPMMGERGGLIDMEAPMAIGKVMLYCNSCSKPTRISFDVLKDGTKTRVCKHCKSQFDK
jgi:large subunit ribosomal protein L24